MESPKFEKKFKLMLLNRVWLHSLFIKLAVMKYAGNKNTIKLIIYLEFLTEIASLS